MNEFKTTQKLQPILQPKTLVLWALYYIVVLVVLNIIDNNI